MEYPRQVVSAALGVLLQLLAALRRALEGQVQGGFSWLNPSLECRYPVAWSWTEDAPVEEEPLDTAAATSPLSTIDNLEVFRALTHGTGWKIHDGLARPLVTEEQKALLETLPKSQRHALLDEITEPFTLIVTRSREDRSVGRRNLFSLPTDTLVADVSGTSVVIGIRLEVHTLVVDHDAKRAYYPVIVSLEYSAKPEGLGGWLAEHGQEIWVPLSDAVGRLSRTLEGIDFQDGEAVASSPRASDRAERLARVPEVGPRITFPEQRRSVMSPVPMPRAIGKEAATLAVIRGLGRMFAGYAGVLDLDINGAVAVGEARRCLLSTLEEHLAARGIEYHRNEEDGRVTYTLLNCQPSEASEIWAAVERAMNRGNGGPGVEARAPGIEGASRFENGSVITETRLLFWPERQAAGSSQPVHFRSQSAPGYLALLEQFGKHPYFAAGWLWIKQGQEREGFRIGGLSALLFTEGRAALQRVGERQIAEREAELSRLLRDPQLLGGPDHKVVQELRGSIITLRKWLAALSVYDVSHDLILCLLETFHRQRDHWARQEIVIKNGVVSTAPYRILQVDPKELRLRVDPGGKWGDNWRARLFDGFSALATFERQTRTETGRKVDVGDRLVHRVIDGLRPADGAAHPKPDADVGLVRLLKQVGALPCDMFYVEVSVDFIARLITWAVEESGPVRWGIDAAGHAKPADGADSELWPGRQPYYQHSPRLLAFSNLEDWPVSRKLLASALLQEVTPGRRRGRQRGARRKLTVEIEGQPYLACNGSGGRGYKIQTWMERSGAGEADRKSLAQFITDVEALVEAINLRIELEGETDTENRLLRGLAADPDAALGTMLRAYLPADLEDRLRGQLAERAHIEACDSEEEAKRGAMTASDLRSARLLAGVTQDAVARAMGVSKMAVSKWEQGKCPIPEGRQDDIRNVLTGGGGEISKPEVTKSAPK
jgi:DNA-binding transcriptional regulator YiaG